MSDSAAEPRALGRIVIANVALNKGEPQKAIDILLEANSILDTWLGHFDLGRAYLASSAAAQADSEFDRCLKRRGEALSVLLDEEPTYGYLPMAYYYQGRVRQQLNPGGFAESYRRYIEIRGGSSEDPLLSEVRALAANR